MSDPIDRQAAIDALERIFNRCEEIEAHFPDGDPDKTGYKMFPDYMTVWKYLRQLPPAMNDLISRQAAINVLEERLQANGYSNAALVSELNRSIGYLKRLPSAERHGRWLMTDGYPHKVYCSECYATLIPNVEWFKTYNIASNYCPNCGAKMDEVEE